MKKVLLREFYSFECKDGICQDFLTEAEKKHNADGGLIFPAKLQEADVKNGNGRSYPKAILEREVNNYKNLISDNRAYGELDHPDDSVINLKNVSHMITEVFWNGNDVMGKVKVLDTPSGNIMKSIINSGGKMGFSSRSLGTVTENNDTTTVNDDLQLICFDAVSEPSTPGAFALNENVTQKPFERIDRVRRLLNEIKGL